VVLLLLPNFRGEEFGARGNSAIEKPLKRGSNRIRSKIPQVLNSSVAPLLVENWLIQTIKAAIWTSTKTWKAAKLPGFNVAG
jgi:hypothetical protein